MAEKHNVDLFSRIRRFSERAGSPLGFAKALIEEGLVRLYSDVAVRSVISSFASPRHPQKWVFIVGCYNSGTTLLQRILSAHPEISAMPREGVRFTTWLSDLQLDGHHMMWAENYRDSATPAVDRSEAALQGIIRDWSIFLKKDAIAFLEKSVANTARIGWLAENFPNPYFVGICRNGYCVAEGLRRRARPPAWLQAQTGSDQYSMDATARQWVTANRDLLDGLKRVEKSFLLRFEDLVASPARSVRDVLKFIDLDTASVIATGEGVRIGTKTYKVSNPNPDSLRRLSHDDRMIVSPIIADMMRKLGYALEPMDSYNTASR